MAKNNQKTDIEKLESIKSRLRAEIKEQERVLDQNFSFIQQNAGSLLVGSMVNAVKENVSLGLLGNFLLPFRKKTTENKNSKTETSKPFQLKQIFNEFLPVITEMALPFILQAGVSILKKKFFRNK